MLRPHPSYISVLPAVVKALPEDEVYSVNGGLGDLKGRLKFLFTLRALPLSPTGLYTASINALMEQLVYVEHATASLHRQGARTGSH